MWRDRSTQTMLSAMRVNERAGGVILFALALACVECAPRPHAGPPSEPPLPVPLGEAHEMPTADTAPSEIPPWEVAPENDTPATREEDAPTPDDPPLAHPEHTPAYRYARLDRRTCIAELDRRHIPYTTVDQARGVLIPIRFSGPLHGVHFRGLAPEKQRSTSPYEIVDCRLALALDDFSALLEEHQIVEVVHFSMYRPPSAKHWPAGKIGARHSGALALDAGVFKKRDGKVLSVEKDFHGRIGIKRTCDPKFGPAPATAEALELRSIVCAAGQRHTFNLELTPNFNRPHYNHFHLEVTANVKWFIVH